jgi:hypothetical protein
MTDPTRWIDNPEDAPRQAADMLREARASGMPDATEREIWRRLAALGPPPGAPPAPSAPPTPSGTGGAATGIGVGSGSKLLLGGSGVLAALGLGVLGIATWTAPAAPPPEPFTVSASVAASAPAKPPVAASSREPARSPERAAASGTKDGVKVGRSSPTPASATSQIEEETRALLAVRRALRGGDPSTALRLLQQLRARFPRRVLAQESEALTIEALSRSGQQGLATQRATEFVARYPESPYAAEVRNHGGLR